MCTTIYAQIAGFDGTLYVELNHSMYYMQRWGSLEAKEKKNHQRTKSTSAPRSAD